MVFYSAYNQWSYFKIQYIDFHFLYNQSQASIHSESQRCLINSTKFKQNLFINVINNINVLL